MILNNRIEVPSPGLFAKSIPFLAEAQWK